MYELVGKISLVVAAVFGFVGLFILLGLLFSYPAMLLWNACLVPAIPGINEIGWMQAFGILVLSGLLFKSSNVG